MPAKSSREEPFLKFLEVQSIHIRRGFSPPCRVLIFQRILRLSEFRELFLRQPTGRVDARFILAARRRRRNAHALLPNLVWRRFVDINRRWWPTEILAKGATIGCGRKNKKHNFPLARHNKYWYIMGQSTRDSISSASLVKKTKDQKNG